MSDSLSDLPDDVRQAIAPHADAPPSVLAAIGVQIAGKREEAKGARGLSGIESTWKECEEAYLGIDDANRHEFTDARWAKPMSMDGPVTTGRKPKQTDHRSTVFLRLTSRYVDAGVAKLGEILLPADDKAFSFSEMPVPELLAAKEDASQVVHSGLGAPLTRPLAQGEAAPAPAPAPAPPLAALPAPAPAPVPGQASQAPAPPGASSALPAAPPAPSLAQSAVPAAPAPPRVPLTVKDFAIEAIEMARKKAKAAETRIYDWMTQTHYRAEIRKVICDAARIGVGVLKAPTPQSKRVMAITESRDGGVDLQIKEKIIPAAVWVDPWNIFPDPACGENIHDGDFVFERDHMSARQLRALRKLPGYIGPQIDKVLEEGPNKVNSEGDGRGSGSSSEGRAGRTTLQKGRFEVWYFYGALTKDEMQAIDQAAGKNTREATGQDDAACDGAGESHVIVTLINDSLVRATINPLDSGSFPYHSMPWQRRAQHWAGVGVAEQMRTPQKVTNAALRALLNNAGKSAGSQFVVDQGAIRPADDNWTITPDKIWYKTNDGPADVRQSFMAIQIPNVTQELMQIITLGERFAEETTSIPLIAQGQSGATTPDTFGAAQLQNNNANQLLRSIGYAFDDYITEPVIRQYYEWLLLDPDVPNEEKGEFQIDAHGSIALVERAIQDQSIAQMGNMAANPIYGIDPKKWAKLFLKSKRLNPEAVQYTEEEQQKMAAAPPPEAPAVTVAKIVQDTQLKLGVMKQTADQQTTQAEGQIAAAAHVLEGGKAQIEQTRVHGELTIKAHELEMRREVALMDYANRQKISLDQAKAQLAKTAMQLSTERELNAANNAHEMRKHRTPQPASPAGRAVRTTPPVQAPGRAANGHGFDQSTLRSDWGAVVDDPFTLTEHDKAQGLWRRLEAHLEDRLADARKRNDAALTEPETASLRGEIRCLKRIIALGDDRPMTGDEE
jgi:hypothetical protein